MNAVKPRLIPSHRPTATRRFENLDLATHPHDLSPPASDTGIVWGASASRLCEIVFFTYAPARGRCSPIQTIPVLGVRPGRSPNDQPAPETPWSQQILFFAPDVRIAPLEADA